MMTLFLVFLPGAHDCTRAPCTSAPIPVTHMQATYEIFTAAVAYCKPGRPYSGIGGVIQEMVDERGYSTISNFCEGKQFGSFGSLAPGGAVVKSVTGAVYITGSTGSP